MSKGSTLRRTVQAARGFRIPSKKQRLATVVRALKAIVKDQKDAQGIATAALIVLGGK